jgi:integrase
MANSVPKFYLKNKDRELSTIMMKIYHRGREKDFNYPLVASASLRVLYIPTACWNSEAQEPKKKNLIPAKFKDKTATIDLVRTIIHKLKGYVEEILVNAELNGINITNDYIRRELDRKQGIVRKKHISAEDEILSLVEYYGRKISKMSDGSFVQPKNGKRYDEGTIKGHITCKKTLQGFDICKARTTYFQDINNEWYDEYILFLSEEQEIFNNEGRIDFIKEPLALNTIGSKHIKNLKFIMERAFNDGVNNSVEHKRDYFMRPKEPSFAIALDEKELRAIYDTKALNKKEQIAKDLFLVGAYTCLRYSDFSVIKPHNFKMVDGVEIIEKATHKDKDRVQIPVLWDELKEIVKRYDYNLPYIDSQSLNELIKIIGERAKINRIEEFHQTKGGETTLIQVPRYKLIASHTARRSAATNLIKRNYSYDRVRLLTGHSKNEQLQQYIILDKEDNAITMAKDFRKNGDENG